MKAYKIERPSRESLAGRREDPKSHRQVHPVRCFSLFYVVTQRLSVVFQKYTVIFFFVYVMNVT